MQGNRSVSSRFSDPILPDNLDSVKQIFKTVRFLPKKHKGYMFIIQVHSDGTDWANNSNNPNPNICWSLFAKLGRQTEMIWRFHRFSAAVLKEVYPNYHERALNAESQLSLLQASVDTDKTTVIGQSQTPIDRLARYLEYVCRIIAD